MLKRVMVVMLGLVISGVFMLAITAAPAKKACNDLKVDQCKKRDDCTWIDKTKKKDGKEVKAYCKCKGKCK